MYIHTCYFLCSHCLVPMLLQLSRNPGLSVHFLACWCHQLGLPCQCVPELAMALLITISTSSTLRAHGAKEEVLLRKLFLQFFSTVLIPATLEFHCHEMSQNTGCLASVSGQREEKKKKKSNHCTPVLWALQVFMSGF